MNNNKVTSIHAKDNASRKTTAVAQFLTGSTAPKRTGEKGVNAILPPRMAKRVIDEEKLIRVSDISNSKMNFYKFKDGIYQPVRDTEIKSCFHRYISEYNPDYLMSKTINEAFKLVTTDPDIKQITVDEFNSDKRYICFENGLLRLEDMKLLPHTPDVYYTVKVRCDWKEDPVATPVFDGYLDKLTSNDKGVQDLLWEFLGLTISNFPGYYTKQAVFLYGPGNTGKSKLFELLRLLLGEETCCSKNLKQLEGRFGASELFGKRVAGNGDMTMKTSIPDLNIFKQLTGGDILSSEKKFCDSFNFKYKGTLLFCMNDLVSFGGDRGDWVYNRIIPVSCNNPIPDEEQDVRLLEKFQAELEGIVQKAVPALFRLVDRDFKYDEPEIIKINRATYKRNNDPVASFVNECFVTYDSDDAFRICKGDKPVRIKVSDIYATFKNWCRDNTTIKTPLVSEFRRTLTDITGADEYNDLTSRTGKDGIFYIDYTIRQEVFETYGPVKTYRC